MSMANNFLYRYFLVFLFGGLTLPIFAKDQTDNDSLIENYLQNTDIDLSFRVRNEQVERRDQTAHANTVKFRIRSKTSISQNWRFEIELDHVETLSKAHHSDGVVANGKLVIPDPEGTEINQLFLNINYESLQARLGRQKIAFSEQRFVGSVDFRQNDQTFDAISLKTSLMTSSQLDYAFITNVNRIFGDNASPYLAPEDIRFEDLAGIRPAGLRGDHRVNGNLVNFSIKEWDHLEVNSYYYRIVNKTSPNFSNQTHGIRAEYLKKIGKTHLLANIELALQQQENSPVDDWLTYSMFEIGARYKSFQLSVRQERLNEKDGTAFITPLATLHKFNGWTDQFLHTPAEGLLDHRVRLQWKKRPITIDFRYHQYSTSKNAAPIGSEINVDFIYSLHRKHEIRVRYADFNAESDQQIVLNSINKLFLIHSYNF